MDREGTYVPPCQAAGLQLRSRDREHRYFRPSPDRPRDVHVHVCTAGRRWERVHLLFRDYLRANPPACDAYAAMKREAAALAGRRARLHRSQERSHPRSARPGGPLGG
jgi:GrpB-like predicted nucleotidyltransferase (UPF0157 family)